MCTHTIDGGNKTTGAVEFRVFEPHRGIKLGSKIREIGVKTIRFD